MGIGAGPRLTIELRPPDHLDSAAIAELIDYLESCVGTRGQHVPAEPWRGAGGPGIDIVFLWIARAADAATVAALLAAGLRWARGRFTRTSDPKVIVVGYWEEHGTGRVLEARKVRSASEPEEDVTEQFRAGVYE